MKKLVVILIIFLSLPTLIFSNENQLQIYKSTILVCNINIKEKTEILITENPINYDNFVVEIQDICVKIDDIFITNNLKNPVYDVDMNIKKGYYHSFKDCIIDVAKGLYLEYLPENSHGKIVIGFCSQHKADNIIDEKVSKFFNFKTMRSA